MWGDIWSQTLTGALAAAILGIVAVSLRSIRQTIPKIGNWIAQKLPFIGYYLKLRRHVDRKTPLYNFRRSGVSRRPSWYPKTICMMNFKGGVGKTTITANLAASLSKHKGLKALIVDLDYQGSLSFLLHRSTIDQNNSNVIGKWLEYDRVGRDRDLFEDTIELGPAWGMSRWISSDYSLTDIESNQLQRWLLRMPTFGDVRSRLLRWLSRPEFENRFDIVLFDAPPRLSLASINALVASQYILIPTRLDPISVQPVHRMLGSLSQLKEQIGADFQIAGAICNMSNNADGPVAGEQAALSTLEEALVGQTGGPAVLRPFVRNAPVFGRPEGASIAYLQPGAAGDEPRRVFDRLTDQLCIRIGLAR